MPLPSCSSGEPADCSSLSALTLHSWMHMDSTACGTAASSHSIPGQLCWGDKRGESSYQWVLYMIQAGSD